ncbi:MAG: hypothetical protein R3E09_13140 [Novosphingobium sp.]|nr:hypothetical protein [Novosphingobium sp.]
MADAFDVMQHGHVAVITGGANRAAHDLIEVRPALSRWHPDWKERFEAFMAQDRPGKGRSGGKRSKTVWK